MHKLVLVIIWVKLEDLLVMAFQRWYVKGIALMDAPIIYRH